jgi:hypothetical protein
LTTVRTIRRTTADHVTISGLFTSGAQSSAIVHGGVWQIDGDKGIIEIRGETTFAVSMSGGVTIKLQDLASDEVQAIQSTEDRPGPPENIGRLCDTFADDGGQQHWKWAVKRHVWVDALCRSYEKGERVVYLSVTVRYLCL